jgi:hypothetical protein
MNHLEMNLQNGIILEENLPIGAYSKHNNTLVMTNLSELILRDESFKGKDLIYCLIGRSLKEKEVINYVLDNGILSRSKKLEVKYAGSLNVGYMDSMTYEMKHV